MVLKTTVLKESRKQWLPKLTSEAAVCRCSSIGALGISQCL